MSEITVEFPKASPADYLRWMAFWREVEQKMGESPALEELATSESAGFVRGDVAEFLSGIVNSVSSQAKDASARGEGTFAPTLVVDEGMFRLGVADFALRIKWLTDERCRAMGIEPLDPSLVQLRTRVLEAVATRLQEPPGRP
jgi:hypothetical protein